MDDLASQRPLRLEKLAISHLKEPHPFLSRNLGLEYVVLHGGQIAEAEAWVAVIWHFSQPVFNVFPCFLRALKHRIKI